MTVWAGAVSAVLLAVKLLIEINCGDLAACQRDHPNEVRSNKYALREMKEDGGKAPPSSGIGRTAYEIIELILN